MAFVVYFVWTVFVMFSYLVIYAFYVCDQQQFNFLKISVFFNQMNLCFLTSISVTLRSYLVIFLRTKLYTF